jgi:hypothetical protein
MGERRSQWPHGLRHEMASPAQTLEIVGSNRIHVMEVYVHYMLSCVGSGLGAGMIPGPGVLPTLYNIQISELFNSE